MSAFVKSMLATAVVVQASIANLGDLRESVSSADHERRKLRNFRDQKCEPTRHSVASGSLHSSVSSVRLAKKSKLNPEKVQQLQSQRPASLTESQFSGLSDAERRALMQQMPDFDSLRGSIPEARQHIDINARDINGGVTQLHRGSEKGLPSYDPSKGFDHSQTGDDLLKYEPVEIGALDMAENFDKIDSEESQGFVSVKDEAESSDGDFVNVPERVNAEKIMPEGFAREQRAREAQVPSKFKRSLGQVVTKLGLNKRKRQ